MKKETRVSERITVKMAKEFLDSRRDNQRPLSQRHVAELANAILFGRWIPNGESIKFDTDGQMMDGQHRCAAGVKAGKPFVSDIVYGLPKSAYYTIDQKSKRRSSGDVLKMNGEISTSTLAAALAWNIAHERDCIGKNGKQWLVSPDAQQICTELDRHPDMRESVSLARLGHRIMPAGPLAFLHYRFAEKDSVLAKAFLQSLSTGSDLSNTNPILYLRKKLLEDKIQNKAKLPIGEKMAYVIKAWNMVRKGKKAHSVVSLKWTSSGGTKEAFPVIQ